MSRPCPSPTPCSRHFLRRSPVLIPSTPTLLLRLSTTPFRTPKRCRHPDLRTGAGCLACVPAGAMLKMRRATHIAWVAVYFIFVPLAYNINLFDFLGRALRGAAGHSPFTFLEKGRPASVFSGQLAHAPSWSKRRCTHRRRCSVSIRKRLDVGRSYSNATGNNNFPGPGCNMISSSTMSHSKQNGHQILFIIEASAALQKGERSGWSVPRVLHDDAVPADHPARSIPTCQVAVDRGGPPSCISSMTWRDVRPQRRLGGLDGAFPVSRCGFAVEGLREARHGDSGTGRGRGWRHFDSYCETQGLRFRGVDVRRPGGRAARSPRRPELHPAIMDGDVGARRSGRWRVRWPHSCSGGPDAMLWTSRATTWTSKASSGSRNSSSKGYEAPAAMTSHETGVS